MRHASVGIAFSTIAFALVLAALATEALGESRTRLLPDGSSLTVGARTQVTVSADLTINVSHGVLRFVGGKISETTPVVIGTPASTLTVRGGSAIVSVTPTTTIAILESGEEMKVVANGETQTVSRPGWQVTTFAGKAPGAPARTPPGSLSTDIARLEGRGNAAAVNQAVLHAAR